MKSNLVKRVDRLPKPKSTSAAMQPLFEAISNAVHSTQKKHGEAVATDGSVTVEVKTDRKKDVWITVEDNGTGLDATNFEAFTTTDTDHKIAIGGKGVGRLLWLDCFAKIRISSVFEEGGALKRRKFDFVLKQQDQIQGQTIEDAPDAQATGVYIRFDGLRENQYRDKFPSRSDAVFQHLTSHFLPAFIGGRCPVMSVTCGSETRVYPRAIDQIVLRRSEPLKLTSEAFGDLQLTLMECDKVASADLKGRHFVHFIAHDRTVHSQSVDGKLGLERFGDNKDRVFHAILSGAFLDENVNQERTDFMFEDSVRDQIINDVCWDSIEKFLEEPLARLNQAQREKIEEITSAYPSVKFGSVDELQDRIPSGELTSDAIFGHLSRERYRRDQRQGDKIRAVMQRLKEGGPDNDALTAAIIEAKNAIEDAEQKSLAEYVVRRKVVLDFLEILLEKVRTTERDSSYQREDVLHSFICPMRVRTVGTDLKVEPAASHDLWIIDERLTFAQYFSSDVPFDALAEASQSTERSDLLIFDQVHGLRQTDQPSKVLLVEFKRPGRTDYDENENPQMQVERYVRELLSNGLNDVKGRPIRLGPETVFNCFIVADIVGKLDNWTFSWPRTASGKGRFFQPQHGFRGSIELIGWDDLLADAKLRNIAFFEKAGISGKSFFSTESSKD